MNAHDRLLLDGVRAGDAAAVSAALAAGAAVEARDEQLHTPLLLAALGDHVAAAAVLLAAGADPELADQDGVTSYEHAVRRGFEGMARILRAAGAAGDEPGSGYEREAGR
ncbi:ankyrin repeat domain-containing protein [Streptomyces sp. 147326]|uniref:ankyrin repeat domain-containing protein n=1 Tax=Streptomyces sp. 147326 TaxID=3074379 RepID=UPI003857DAA5